MEPGIGHNDSPSFKTIVGENLRNLLLVQRDVLMTAVDDPRLSMRHLRVLVKIIERTNSQTGVAFPGRTRIAEDTGTLYGAGEAQPLDGGLTEATIARTLYELTKFGYLVSARFAPEPGRRALAHYSIVRPSVDILQNEIMLYIEQIRERGPKGKPKNLPQLPLTNPDVTTGIHLSDPDESTLADPDGEPCGNVTGLTRIPVSPSERADSEPCLTIREARQRRLEAAEGDEIGPDVTTGLQADVTTGLQTVTGKKELEVGTRKESLVAAVENKPRVRDAEPDAAAADSYDLSEDIITFIAKHTRVNRDEARNMMAHNIRAYGEELFSEAYNRTLAVVRSRNVAHPYHYLLKLAGGIREDRRLAQVNHKITFKPDWDASFERLKQKKIREMSGGK